MNSIVLSSFVIPACVAFVLIALLIKERYNLLPKKTNVNTPLNKNENNQTAKLKIRDSRKDRIVYGKRYPDDFLDFSGGSMGI